MFFSMFVVNNFLTTVPFMEIKCGNRFYTKFMLNCDLKISVIYILLMLIIIAVSY